MESFSTAHRDLTLSNNGQTVTGNISGGFSYRNAYGSIGIKSTTKNKYKWKLTINKKTSDMFVGIASHKNIDADYNKIDYGYNGNTGSKRNTYKYEEYGIRWKSGDVVSVNVDFNKKEVSFGVNGECQGVAFKNIVIGPTYYLVVSICCYDKGDSITITHFDGVDLLEEKEKETSINLESENCKLKEEIIELRQKLKSSLSNIGKLELEISGLKDDKKKDKQKLDSLSSNSRKLNQENNTLKMQNIELLDDKKEMELKVIELKEENRKLNGYNLDHRKWREWKAEKVFYFIMSTVDDGSLDEYENAIKTEIFESEYTGKDLQDIEFHHIKSMGIKKISVRNAVFKAIQKIVQNKDNKPQIDEVMVDNAPTAYI